MDHRRDPVRGRAGEPQALQARRWCRRNRWPSWHVLRTRVAHETWKIRASAFTPDLDDPVLLCEVRSNCARVTPSNGSTRSANICRAGRRKVRPRCHRPFTGHVLCHSRANSGENERALVPNLARQRPGQSTRYNGSARCAWKSGGEGQLTAIGRRQKIPSTML